MGSGSKSGSLIGGTAARSKRGEKGILQVPRCKMLLFFERSRVLQMKAGLVLIFERIARIQCSEGRRNGEENI